MEKNYLEGFIEGLLHINEGAQNKLIDLEAGDPTKTLYLSHKIYEANLYQYAFDVIKKRIGKVGNTVLKGSALKSEQIRGRDVNDFLWRAGDGSQSPLQLDKYISDCYKEIKFKGNNPLFLSVGAVKWKITIAKDVTKDVLSPLLIFPIRLIRSVDTSPVCIEFVDDDAYFNPCLVAKFRQVLGAEVAKSFPHPNGGGQFDKPIELAKLEAGGLYFSEVSRYVEECKRADSEGGTVFEFLPNLVAIAQYNHDEMCTYYDIKRNHDKIYQSRLVEKIFTPSYPDPIPPLGAEPKIVLPHDSVQEDMIRRVVSGESLVIKGPPGTGKTQTIANMIATLMAENKKVLLSSKKLSALSEVYAKLPANLRKFVLLMESESERDAANVNPTEIKKQFRKLLGERKTYVEPAWSRELSEAEADCAQAMAVLKDYTESSYGNAAIAMGDRYYDIIDTCLKNDLPVLPFAEPEEVAKVTRDAYSAMCSKLKEIEIHYATLTKNGKHTVERSPWFGVSGATDTEQAFAAYEETARLAEEIYADGAHLFEEFDAVYQELSVGDVYALMTSTLTEEQTKNALDYQFRPEAKLVFAAFAEWLIAKLGWENEKASLADAEQTRTLLASFPQEGVDAELTVGKAELLYRNAKLFDGAGGFLSPLDVANLVAATVKYEQIKQSQDAMFDEARKVFTEQVFQANAEALCAAAKAFAKYDGEEKPGFFDFGAKKYCKQMQELSYLQNVPFPALVRAVKQFDGMLAKEAELKALYNQMNAIFRKELSEDERKAVLYLFSAQVAGKGEPQAYLQGVLSARNAIVDLARQIDAGEDTTVSRLLGVSRMLVAKAELVCALQKVGVEADAQGAESAAKSVLAAYGVFGKPPFSYRTSQDNADFAKTLQSAHPSCRRHIEAYYAQQQAFAKNYFVNYYSDNFRVTYADVKIVAEEGKDREILSAALRYALLAGDKENALSLSAFLSPLEKGEIAKEDALTVMFEHSFYSLAREWYVKYVLGAKRNGRGAAVQSSLVRLADAQARKRKANADEIESRCMRRIDTEDRAFAFLDSERDPSQTLRSMFKNHAKGILKLNKCIILSPATASVLFRPEEYEDFDVVIVDEASQLEPVNILPVLFRSKQCVLVGDEWQMPPIKNFVNKTDLEIDSGEGEVTFIESDISVLTLALRNQSMRSEELLCHYRSKTESMIRLSQSQFYPNMRTFPSPLPVTEGLGFVDEYVPDGRCVGGVNKAEAKRVVEVIRRHFDRYYDEETGVLSESFGVVSFGTKQIECIEKIVNEDRVLSAKIERAKKNFKDVEEKLIFYKTILTVQGQETAHLILSFTYGRNPQGSPIGRFGMLNQEKIGKCVFNVAVTRGQSSVTVVHSVLASEIENPSVAFIKEYLQIAEEYSKGGKGQFVSEPAAPGFLRDVGEFIVSQGIDESRVVFNYGVTNGSVRIPIAVLSADMSRALLGIWCEVPTGKKYDYLDYNLRYEAILKSYGWKLYPIYAHDWMDNAKAEKERLAQQLKQF